MSGAAAAGAAGGAGGRRSANAGAAGSDGDTITVAPPTADRSQDDAPLTAEEMEAARSKRKRADVGQSTLAASGFMWTAAAPVGGRGSAGAGAKAPAVTVADDATMVFDVKRHYSQPDQNVKSIVCNGCAGVFTNTLVIGQGCVLANAKSHFTRGAGCPADKKNGYKIRTAIERESAAAATDTQPQYNHARPDDRKMLRFLFTMWIVMNMRPINILRDVYLRRIVEYLNPQARVPAKETVRAIIEEQAATIKRRMGLLMKALRSAAKRDHLSVLKLPTRPHGVGIGVCATGDMYSTSAQASFLFGTVHAVSDNFERFEGTFMPHVEDKRHLGPVIKVAFQDMLASVSLGPKDVYVTTRDGGSNIKAGFDLLGLVTLYCICHRISLIIGEATVADASDTSPSAVVVREWRTKVIAYNTKIKYSNICKEGLKLLWRTQIDAYDAQQKRQAAEALAVDMEKEGVGAAAAGADELAPVGGGEPEVVDDDSASEDEDAPETPQRRRFLAWAHSKTTAKRVNELLARRKMVFPLRHIPIRWCSLFYVFQRLVELQSLLVSLHSTIAGVDESPLTAGDWTSIAVFASLFRSMALTVTFQEGGSYPTMSLIPIMIGMMLKELTRDNAVVTRDGQVSLEEHWGPVGQGLRSRARTEAHRVFPTYAKLNEGGLPVPFTAGHQIEVLVAAAVDPRCRHLGTIYGVHLDGAAVVAKVWEVLTEQVRLLIEAERADAAAAGAAEEDDADGEDEGDGVDESGGEGVWDETGAERDARLMIEATMAQVDAIAGAAGGVVDAQVEAANEVKKYKMEQSPVGNIFAAHYVFDLKKFIEHDPAPYWRANKSKYPHLWILARVFLCPLASSAPSERVGSTATFISGGCASGMDADTLRLQVYVKRNRMLLEEWARVKKEFGIKAD